MDINSDCALDDEFVIHDNAKKSKLDEAMASKAKYNSELQGSWWREIPMLWFIHALFEHDKIKAAFHIVTTPSHG